MVHDYSRRYSSVMGSRQQVRSRRQSREAAPFMLSRVLGSVMLLIVASGVGLSVWLKMRIDQDLSELGRKVERQQVLLGEQQAFKDQRDRQQTVDAMADRAQRLGLAAPAEAQIRTP